MKKFLIILFLMFILSLSSCRRSDDITISTEPINEFNITCLDDYLIYMDMLVSYQYGDNDALLINKNIKFTSEVIKDYQVTDIVDYSFNIDFALYGNSYAYYAYNDGNYIYDFCSGQLAAVNLPVDYFYLAYQNSKIVGLKNEKRKYVSVDETRKIFNVFPEFTKEEHQDLARIYCDFDTDDELNENYLRYNNLSMLVNNYIYVYALNSGQEYFITSEYDRSMIKDFTTNKENNKIYFSYNIESLDDKSYTDDDKNIKDIYSTVNGSIDVDTKLLSIYIDYIVNNNGKLWKHVIINNIIEEYNESIIFNEEIEYNESIDAIHY